MHESQGATPGLRARFSSNDHGDAISRTDLVGFGLIEDGPDPALDEIVRIAARITRCEKAFITFAHNDQLHVIASVGSSVSQTPAALSVCGVTYREDAPLIVPDLSRDNRFKDYPYVAREDGNRFYAGFPMRLACGTSIGSLCVIDRKVREAALDDAQLASMQSLTALCLCVIPSHARTGCVRNPPADRGNCGSAATALHWLPQPGPCCHRSAARLQSPFDCEPSMHRVCSSSV